MRKRNPTIWIVWKILVICTSFHLPYGNYQGAAKRAVSELRKKICFYFYLELGIPVTEVARHGGVGTTGWPWRLRG